MPTSFNTDGKPAYIYNQPTDTWFQVAGKTDTSGTFEWAGDHTFLSSVEFVAHVISQDGINNVLNPAQRDSQIPTPSTGSVCFLRQDEVGNIINTIQFYSGSEWVDLIPSPVGQNGKFLKSNGTISIWENADAMTQTILMMGA